MSRQRDNVVGESIVDSSGDVFADLGIELTPEEAVKVEIARQITRVINARELTQAQVGKLLGVDQAKVSQVTKGRLSGFSTGRLLRFLLALGYDVGIELKPSRSERGHVTVRAAGERARVLT